MHCGRISVNGYTPASNTASITKWSRSPIPLIRSHSRFWRCCSSGRCIPTRWPPPLKQRHKGESIKIRYGSLYTVIELLVKRGFITAKETSREGKRPERTVFALTRSGYDELRAWMQDLLRDPVNDYPQFAAGLSLLPVLPPEEAVALLRQRACACRRSDTDRNPSGRARTSKSMPVPARRIAPSARWKEISAAVRRGNRIRAGPDQGRACLRQRARPPHRRRGWGPLDLWRELQAACVRQHEANGVAREGAM